MLRCRSNIAGDGDDSPGAGVAALAAAALLLESTLTRLLAVAQFYHFAFLVVSLALLGFGASGTLLSLLPRLGRIPTRTLLSWSGLGFAAATGVAYAEGKDGGVEHDTTARHGAGAGAALGCEEGSI